MNVVSLFGAVKVNGINLIQNPSTFFEQVSASSIMWVKQPVSITNAYGQPQMAFEIRYQNPKGLTEDSFFLPKETNADTAGNNLQNLTDFLNGLIAVGGARNQFSILNNLFKTSNQPPNMLPGNQSILINNDFIYAINYLATPNLTAVTINRTNALSKFVMYFTGDQLSGDSLAYSYFGALGNK